jgi:hypothetical protein
MRYLIPDPLPMPVLSRNIRACTSSIAVASEAALDVVWRLRDAAEVESELGAILRELHMRLLSARQAM